MPVDSQILSGVGESQMRLGVILLNPPEGTGKATRRNLEAGLESFGNPEIRLANLFATATRNVAAINEVGVKPEGWALARPPIEKVLRSSDQILFGWGVGSLHGIARQNFLNQIKWLRATALEMRHDSYWTIGSEPRHPSRWHQYVSDVHGRTSGGTLSSRLAQVLVRTPL